MKKVKCCLVSLLTIVMALFCFAGCGPVGKYTATKYKLGGISMDIDNSESYIELKLDKTATIHIDISVINMTIEDSGTWEKSEDNKVIITGENLTYTVTVDGNTLTYGVVVFEK